MQLPARFSDWTPPYAIWGAALLALFAWMTPNHEPPWAAFVGELGMAVSAVVLGAWVLWVTRREPGSLPYLAMLALFAALLPWFHLASGRIPFMGIAVLASLYLAGFALVVVMGYRAAAHWSAPRVLDSIALVLVIGGVLSMGLAIYGWQRWDFLTYYFSGVFGTGRATANLNQPNHLATLLVMSLLSTGALLDAKKINRPVALALAALFGLGLAMTDSRAGLLEVLLAAALLVAMKARLQRNLRPLDIVVAVVLVFAMLPLWAYLSSLGGGGAARDAASASTSIANRLTHWQEMLSAIQLRPWLGWGWTSTPEAQYAVAPDFPATREVLGHSHNLVIDLLLWNGLPIGLVLVLGLFGWFGLAVKRAKDSVVLFMLALVLAVATHAMVEYPLYYTYFLLPVALLAGAICRETMPGATWRFALPGIAALAAVAAAVLALVTLDYNGLDEDMRAQRMQDARIGLDTPRRTYSEPRLLSQLHAYLQFYRRPPREGMSAEELEEMARVAKRYPSGQNFVAWASALAMNGRPEEAREPLRRVCKLDSACERMKQRWALIGKKTPSVARIAWPEE